MIKFLPMDGQTPSPMNPAISLYKSLTGAKVKLITTKQGIKKWQWRCGACNKFFSDKTVAKHQSKDGHCPFCNAKVW